MNALAGILFHDEADFDQKKFCMWKWCLIYEVKY